MATNSDASVAVIQRVADILDALSDKDNELGITELHKKLGLGKSTVHRLVTTLVKRGFLQQNQANQKYYLGPTVLRLGLAAGLRSLDIRSLALPLMEQLRDRTGETITLSLRSNYQRLYVAQIESRYEIRQTVDVGRAYPLYLGGTGKAILAFISEEEQGLILREGIEKSIQQPTQPPHLQVDWPKLRQELREIKQQGYAISRGERIPDAASVAAPIFDHTGNVLAAMSVAGPVTRLTPEKQRGFVGALLEVTAELSRRLGGLK